MGDGGWGMGDGGWGGRPMETVCAVYVVQIACAGLERQREVGGTNRINGPAVLGHLGVGGGSGGRSSDRRSLERTVVIVIAAGVLIGRNHPSLVGFSLQFCGRVLGACRAKDRHVLGKGRKEGRKEGRKGDVIGSSTRVL